MGQVDGKVAIVTGGASGIGAACAATLAREGAKVVVTDVDDAGGQAVVDKIGSAGGEAIFLHQDVTLEEGWPGIIDATERRFGRLDVMVATRRAARSGRESRAAEPRYGRRDPQELVPPASDRGRYRFAVLAAGAAGRISLLGLHEPFRDNRRRLYRVAAIRHRPGSIGLYHVRSGHRQSTCQRRRCDRPH